MVISIEAVVSLFIYLLCGGLIFWLLFFLLNYIAPPEPFNKVLRVMLMVCAVLVLIGVLLSFMGHPVVRLSP